MIVSLAKVRASAWNCFCSSDSSKPIMALSSPRGWRAALGLRSPLELAEDLPVDHHALDLAGAFVDLGDAGVAEVALDREVLGVAVAAQHLDGGVGHAAGGLGGDQLGHRRLARGAEPAVLEPGRAVGEEPGRLRSEEHTSELQSRENLVCRL